MRIGLIGTQNSHSSAYGKAFNVDKRLPGAAITLVWGETPECARERAAESSIPTVVDDPSAMLGQIDALIIDTRDGANHLAFAEPFLDSGIPIFIDKPLATDPVKAAAFLDKAAACGARVASHSMVPLQQSFHKFVTAQQALAPLRYLGLSMPAALDSEYSGAFFYVVHAVECLCTLLNRLPLRARIERFAGSNLATLDYPLGPLVTINLQEGNYSYHIMAVGEQDTLAMRLDYDEDPYLTSIQLICDFFTGVAIPASHERLLMPVQILTALEISKISGGWVEVCQ